MDIKSQKIERFFQISRELSSAVDFSSTLISILRAAVELTESDAASILNLEDDHQNLRFLASYPETAMLKTIIVPADSSIAGAISRQKRGFFVNDVSTFHQHFKNADRVTGYKTRSLLGCPIIFRGDVLGVIEVVNKSGNADYNGDELTILETLASYSAIAIQNNHLQALLDKTNLDGLRLEKMKKDFVAITSHELRTPLGLILGHATFLRELTEPEYQPQLDTIIKNAMRLKEIIEDMSSVDNAENGLALVRHTTVSIKQILLDNLENLKSDAENKNIEFDLDIAKSNLAVDGDAEKISTAINNIVKNAITFSNLGGHVRVAAKEVSGFVKVIISDNGIGIPAKDVKHIFERFYQVESHLTRKHGGMGLGLSIAKMMVEMHGGQILLESIEGKGSTFTLLFPQDSAQAASARKVFLE